MTKLCQNSSERHKQLTGLQIGQGRTKKYIFSFSFVNFEQSTTNDCKVNFTNVSTLQQAKHHNLVNRVLCHNISLRGNCLSFYLLFEFAGSFTGWAVRSTVNSISIFPICKPVFLTITCLGDHLINIKIVTNVKTA